MEFRRQLRQILYNQKYNHDQVLAFIKAHVAPGEFEAAINSNPLLKNKRKLNCYFPKAEDIVHRKLHGFTGDLKRELNWVVYLLKSESGQINGFLELKDQFEKHFFLGRHIEAEKILERIRSTYGESLWTIEMTLLLKETISGTQENWECLSDYLNKIDSPYYQFLISFFSKRVEAKMSFENCVIQFRSDFEGLPVDTASKDFLVLKSLNTALYDFYHEDYDGALLLSNLFGVTDQYLIVTEVLLQAVSKRPAHNKLLQNITQKLFKYFPNDKRLINILNLLSKSEPIVFEETEVILPIIDQYSNGEFEYCINKCRELIVDYPFAFELYELYCKSLINLDREFRLTDVGIITDQILESVYGALLFDENSERHIERLLKTALTFSSFNIGKHITAFVATLVGEKSKEHHSLLSVLHSEINSPRLSKYLTVGDINAPVYSHLSFQINAFVNGEDISLPISGNLQADAYLARHFFSRKDYDRVLEIFEDYREKKISPIYYEDLLNLAFNSNLESNRLEEAMILAATIISSDRRFFTRKFDVLRLSQEIKNADISSFGKNIDLPILFCEVYKDYGLYEGYIEFMIENGEERPSKLDIESLIDKCSKQKVIFFLRDVCKVSTMQYSLEFNSLEEVEQERCEICNLLKDLDPDNTSSYNKEISNILKTGAVRRALKEVNDGRLFVNTESLKNIQMSNLKESFARYKEIEYISQERNLVGYNSEQIQDWEIAEPKNVKTKSQFNDPAFLAFKAIYFETREKFLFSKEYGLDSCLSTNFRHGSVKNHIRSVFESLNLITSKLNNDYTDNHYWADKLSLLNPHVQERLRQFSKDIDEYTNHVTNNLIQIRTEKNTDKIEAKFDYSTDNESLLVYFIEHKSRFTSVDEVLDILYSDLINYTQSAIAVSIHRLFTVEISSYYQRLIDKLQADLRFIGIVNHELNSNLQKSATNIQTELEVIADWFSLSTTSQSSLLSLGLIIEASKEYTNRINPNYLINPVIKIKFPISAYSSLIFVFNILFNNIIEHSGLESDVLEVTIDVLEPRGGYVEIKFTNTISSSIDIDKIERKLSEIKSNWNNHENIERSNLEGGSGFDKIKRILLYEAVAKTDKFEYLVSREQVSISIFLPFRATITPIRDIIMGSLELNGLNPYKYEPVISQECISFYTSTNLIFAFRTLIKRMIKYSEFENPDIAIQVAINEENYITVRFKILLSVNVDVAKMNRKLQHISNNWSEEPVDERKYFDKIKRQLSDAGAKTNKFEFDLLNQNLAITLNLPVKHKHEYTSD